jgi:hypothetical protein
MEPNVKQKEVNAECETSKFSKQPLIDHVAI